MQRSLVEEDIADDRNGRLCINYRSGIYDLTELCLPFKDDKRTGFGFLEIICYINYAVDAFMYLFYMVFLNMVLLRIIIR